jgi:hypothetical protein
MVERYAIKFGPAVSQKELEKYLNEASRPEELKRVHLMKARIEIVADFAALQKLATYMKEKSKVPG